jgi:hypothetical protein
MGKSRAIPSSTSYSSSLQRKWPSSSSSELESEEKAEMGTGWGVFARFSSSESSCWSWVGVGETVGGAAGVRRDDMFDPFMLVWLGVGGD